MAGRNEWSCWTLCREDIDHIALSLGVNPIDFTDDDYENIARRFIKGFGWSNEEWESILKEAVNLSMAENNKGKRSR
jgi:hypothetical protein